MKVHIDLTKLPTFRNSVVTIGSFDGVHLGHQKILSKLKRKAIQYKGESVVLTFHPHPRLVLQPERKDLKLLHSLPEKIATLEKYGIDHLIVVPFDKAFSSQSPTDYVHNFLLKNFNPACIVIGYDHKFGKDRSGNIDLLKKEIPKAIEIIEIEKEELNDLAISSTKVRNAIAEGNMQLATSLLGHNYTIQGKVVKGLQLGKSLGFPTANIKVNDDHKLIPAQGIYAVTASIASIEKTDISGMLYIGQRPSIENETALSIEVNLFDFDKNIYEQEIILKIEKFIRGDKKFESLADLSAAIAADKISVESHFQSVKKKQSVLNNPEVAVVILNYNGADHLAEYLPSVINSDYDNLRIIVVDNASTDNSVKLLKKNFPNIELQILPENYGFTGGYAKSLSVIDSEYLILLNSDVRVTSDWISQAMNVILGDDAIGVVQPKILSDKKPRYFEYAGAAGGWLDKWGYPFCRGRLFDTLEVDKNQYDQSETIFWASGCAFLIRNEVYKKVGGLDTQFFAHLEEIDLCWRIQRMGYQIKLAPKSVVYHLGGGTLSYQSPRKTFLNFRNSLIMVLKNKNGIGLYINIFIRLVLDGIAGLKFLLSGKPAFCWAILKAHFSFYGRISNTLKRKSFEEKMIAKNKLPGSANIQGQFKGSIVFQYFIKGKKYFSDLNV